MSMLTLYVYISVARTAQTTYCSAVFLPFFLETREVESKNPLLRILHWTIDKASQSTYLLKILSSRSSQDVWAALRRLRTLQLRSGQGHELRQVRQAAIEEGGRAEHQPPQPWRPREKDRDQTPELGSKGQNRSQKVATPQTNKCSFKASWYLWFVCSNLIAGFIYKYRFFQ